MARPAEQVTRGVIERWGWRPGTTFENRVAHRLHRWGWRPDEIQQQYRVGKFHLDFAWPQIKVALEADGWWHRSPEGAAKDAERDAWLRSKGWVILRVDDRSSDDVALQNQLARVSQIVHALMDSGLARDTW